MNNKKILIVEDEFIIQMFIAKVLSSAGFEISGEASTSNEALRMIEANRPDLILMDIGIKGDMDGIDTALVINTLYNIPVVFITGNSDKTTIEKAMLANPFDIIYKPMDELQLRDKIVTIFSKI